MNDNAIINQRLRDFTVQIVDNDTNYQVYGTAFAVDYLQAKFVTCAHVVKAVLGSMAGTLYIRFPQARGDKKPILPVKVLAYFPDYDDDVALLQLLETEKMPLAPEQIAVVGKAENSDGNEFQSYGFRRLGNYLSGLAKGVIDGHIPAPDNENWCSEDVLQLDSANIHKGMSGAALFDKTKNLVVGIISQTYYPDDTSKDRDTAFGVDARALSLAPLNLKLYDGESYPRKQGAQPTETAPPPAPLRDDVSRAPTVLTGWVGRADLLAELNRIYADTNNRVMGLVGFGGEGKTSLARKWVQTILDDPARKPAGVFWWAFYDDRSVDAFLEALLTYMAGETVTQNVRGASARAQIIGAMMQERRYMVVLDGFEVMQHQDGDEHGRITSEALREFLEFCASQKSQSCCVITTRANLMDMQPFTTYQHVDITRMSEADGLALMREVGVNGDDEAIKKVVKQWDGHALTISLIAGYLADKHAGDIDKVDEVPPPHADEPLYERVKRILRRYDEHLSDAERAFMLMFCAFRTPVRQSAFSTIFRTATNATALNTPITTLDDAEFDALLKRLVARRLINPSETDGAPAYTTHPLIRAHYETALTGYDGAKDHHKAVADLYKAEADEQPYKRLPTLDDLKPYIEMVHHLCRAGAYDEAFQIHLGRIYRGNEYLLPQKLGAEEASLNIMLEFFPDGDTNQDPAVTNPDAQSFILNEIGFCHQNLGRLRQAEAVLRRKNKMSEEAEDYRNASAGYLNLTEIALALGNLDDALAYATQALNWAEKMEAGDARLDMERNSLAYQAWVAHLRGITVGEAGALALFKRAEALEQAIDPTIHYLYSIRGIQHADCLHSTGDPTTARAITDANLEICTDENWLHTVSQCQRVLGDLDADAGQLDDAHTHYDEAETIVRMIDKVDVRIEALLAQGRFFAKHKKDAKSALSDLTEAFNIAVKGEYKRYEADIRIALAWAHLAESNPDDAQREAQTALTMSKDMGYHWGVMDAEDVLKQITAP